MELKVWLKKKKMTQKEFAESCWVSSNYMHLLVNDRIKCGKILAQRIHRKTSGAVHQDTLMSHQALQKKNEYHAEQWAKYKESRKKPTLWAHFWAWFD